MMTRHCLRILPAALLAGMLGPQLANADTYTWVDDSGRVNVSNLAPPDDAHLSKVTHSSLPKSALDDEAVRARARQSEMQALAARVRELEEEVQFATRPAPPQVEYRMMPSPPSVQYNIVDLAQPALANQAPPVNAGCDSTWMDCGTGWGPSYYAPSVVLVRTPPFRRAHFMHSSRHFPAHHPVRTGGGFRRG